VSGSQKLECELFVILAESREEKGEFPYELRQHCHHVQDGAHGSGNLVSVRKSTVSVTIDSPSHPVVPDGLRESSESKPANKIYGEESEVYCFFLYISTSS